MIFYVAINTDGEYYNMYAKKKFSFLKEADAITLVQKWKWIWLNIGVQ